MLASCNPVRAIRKVDGIALCCSVIPVYLDVPSGFLNIILVVIFLLFDILYPFFRTESGQMSHPTEMKGGAFEGDDAQLAAMGHKPELKRQYSMW